MTRVRLIYYVLDPFADERRPVAALIDSADGVQVVRAPGIRLPEAGRANVERILRDIEADPKFVALPDGAGAQAVAGAVRMVPSTVADAPSWVTEALLTEVA